MTDADRDREAQLRRDVVAEIEVDRDIILLLRLLDEARGNSGRVNAFGDDASGGYLHPGAVPLP